MHNNAVLAGYGGFTGVVLSINRSVQRYKKISSKVNARCKRLSRIMFIGERRYSTGLFKIDFILLNPKRRADFFMPVLFAASGTLCARYNEYLFGARDSHIHQIDILISARLDTLKIVFATIAERFFCISQHHVLRCVTVCRPINLSPVRVTAPIAGSTVR